MKSLVPLEHVEQRIYLIRGHRVMLDSDLAGLYGVPTFRLNEQVKRNKRRFPEDFAFRLTPHELSNLKSHFAMSSSSWGGRRTLPLVFTGHDAELGRHAEEIRSVYEAIQQLMEPPVHAKPQIGFKPHRK